MRVREGRDNSSRDRTREAQKKKRRRQKGKGRLDSSVKGIRDAGRAVVGQLEAVEAGLDETPLL
jgi:hypothetical protein